MRFRATVHAVALTTMLSVLLGATPASAAISVSAAPAMLDLAGAPGSVGSVEVRVDNGGDAAFDLITSIIDLDIAEGSPSAVAWADSNPKRLHLEPGVSGTVTVKLDIPREAAPGGAYAALSLTMVSPDSEASPTGVGGRIVVPILLVVGGDEEHPMRAAKPVLERAALFLEPDGGYLARAQVRNDGGVHVPLSGSVTVGRPDLDQPIATVDVPIGRVLPDQSRLFPAAHPFELEPATTYETTLALGVPVNGRESDRPVIHTSFPVETVAQVSLDAPFICTSPDGTFVVGASLINEGSLGVAPAVTIWAEAPDGTQSAVAQPMVGLLAWPDASLDISGTMRTPLAAGEYTLVAEVAYGPNDTIGVEVPFSVGDGAADAVQACDPTTGLPPA